MNRTRCVAPSASGTSRSTRMSTTVFGCACPHFLPPLAAEPLASATLILWGRVSAPRRHWPPRQLTLPFCPLDDFMARQGRHRARRCGDWAVCLASILSAPSRPYPERLWRILWPARAGSGRDGAETGPSVWPQSYPHRPAPTRNDSRWRIDAGVAAGLKFGGGHAIIGTAAAVRAPDCAGVPARPPLNHHLSKRSEKR